MNEGNRILVDSVEEDCRNVGSALCVRIGVAQALALVALARRTLVAERDAKEARVAEQGYRERYMLADEDVKKLQQQLKRRGFCAINEGDKPAAEGAGAAGVGGCAGACALEGVHAGQGKDGNRCGDALGSKGNDEHAGATTALRRQCVNAANLLDAEVMWVRSVLGSPKTAKRIEEAVTILRNL